MARGSWPTLAADTGSTTTSYTDATATEAGETYAYQVKAIRGEDRSQSSNRVALIPVEPPATPETLAPSNLTFEIREHGVTLAWDAPAAAADSVTGYRVVRRRPNQGENEWLVWKWDTGSTETTYRDGHAQTHGEYYIFRVRALRGDDYSKMSNFVQVTRPEAAPGTTEWAPSNLQGQIYVEVALGEEESTTQVKLSWDAPAEGTEWVRGYEVQRAACDGDFTTLVSDTGSTATGYTDSDVEAGESYTYRVRARRPQGKSLWTNWWTILLPGGNGESECAVPAGATGTPATPGEGENYALSAQVQVNANLTPATLEHTLLGYDEAEGTGTLAPNELTFDEGATFRVTSVNTWPGFPGLVLMLTADSSVQDAALADRDFILEADETVLIVGTTEFSFDDATLSHSETTGDNGEYTGVVIATWTEGEAGLVAGETVAFRLERRDRPDEAQFTQHETEVTLVKNTGQTVHSALALNSGITKRAQQFTTGADTYTLGSIGFDFGTIGSTSTAGSHLTVSLYTGYRGTPGTGLCTLSDPSNFTGSGVQTFDAPTRVPCPVLAANTAYYVVVKRVSITSDAITLAVTLSDREDPDGAAGSSVGNTSRYLDGRDWLSDSDGHTLMIEVTATTVSSSTRVPAQDFTALAEGNDRPHGLWSDGTTMWVSQRHNPNFNTGGPSKIFAYDMATKAHKPTEDFNTLVAAGNGVPVGIWSDGTTMFVADEQDRTIYAYDMATKQRDADKEVWEESVFASGYSSSVDVAGLRHHIGSYRETYNYSTFSPPLRAAVRAVVLRNERLYLFMRPALSSSVVVDHHRTDQDFVLEVGDDSFNSADATASIETGSATYSWPAGSLTWTRGDEVSVGLSTAPAPEDLTGADLREFLSDLQIPPNTLLLSSTMTVGESSQTRLPEGAGGLWSDNSTMWVSITGDTSEVLAWDLETGVRTEDEDFTGFHDNNNTQPFGIWADETDIFVADMNDGRVYAYWRNYKLPNSRRDIQLDPLQIASDTDRGPRGIWSDGTTMWVADRGTGNIYAYNLPPIQSPLTFRSRVSVERVTDTTAIVALDLRNLPFGGERQAVSTSINFGSATMYAHPDVGTARFMLRGLQPETKYTVEGKFSNSPSFPMGADAFRTDYARLAGIETSGLTHNEATVEVSLTHADVDKRCCFPYWVSRDESELVYTYYLRHKPSDDTAWSEPVELTFSGRTTDARLTGLDPGTTYDVSCRGRRLRSCRGRRLHAPDGFGGQLLGNAYGGRRRRFRVRRVRRSRIIRPHVREPVPQSHLRGGRRRTLHQLPPDPSLRRARSRSAGSVGGVRRGTSSGSWWIGDRVHAHRGRNGVQQRRCNEREWWIWLRVVVATELVRRRHGRGADRLRRGRALPGRHHAGVVLRHAAPAADAGLRGGDDGACGRSP